MDAHTLEALKGSIAKWQAIVDGHGKDRGTSNCPLCRLFHEDYREDREENCTGCPVHTATSLPCCVNTPYVDFCIAGKTGPEAHEYALAELLFLESLLPKESS